MWSWVLHDRYTQHTSYIQNDRVPIGNHIPTSYYIGTIVVAKVYDEEMPEMPGATKNLLNCRTLNTIPLLYVRIETMMWTKTTTTSFVLPQGRLLWITRRFNVKKYSPCSLLVKHETSSRAL